MSAPIAAGGGLRGGAPVLSGRGISFSYGGEAVLSGVDVEARGGEVTVLLGPNGAGKSTLLRILSGALAPSAGAVALLGRPLASYPRREAARALAAAAQEPPSDFPMSVTEFVSLGRFAHRGFFSPDTAEDRLRVSEAIALAELSPLASRPLYALSAGERQRACVARAVAQGGEALLLDEPAAFLDLRHRVAFHEMVSALASERGTAVLMASHDLHFSAGYGDRIFLLSGGRILAEGTPGEVLTPSLVEAAYGVAVRCDRDPESGAVRVFPRTGRRGGARTP